MPPADPPPAKVPLKDLPHAELPMCYFGEVKPPTDDWVNHDEPDPDDEEMAETPPDVIMMLGFDPLDVDWSEV